MTAERSAPPAQFQPGRDCFEQSRAHARALSGVVGHALAPSGFARKCPTLPRLDREALGSVGSVPIAFGSVDRY
eukprot:8896705-Alexandrium_andersonii.AAC.1